MPPPLPPSLRYYTGRLAAYDEDYKKADEHLGYAYEHCHRDAHSNKKKILRYLIPVGNKADTSAPLYCVTAVCLVSPPTRSPRQVRMLHGVLVPSPFPLSPSLTPTNPPPLPPPVPGRCGCCGAYFQATSFCRSPG